MVTCAGCEKGGKGGRGVTASAAARGRDTAEGGGGCWEGGCCGRWGDHYSGAQGCGSGDGVCARPAAGRAPVRGARAAVALRQSQSLQVSHLQYSNMCRSQFFACLSCSPKKSFMESQAARKFMLGMLECSEYLCTFVCFQMCLC